MALQDLSFLNSQKFQLITVAIVSTAVTTSIIFGTQKLRREIRIQELKESGRHVESRPLTEYGFDSITVNKEKAQPRDYDEDLILEQLTRTKSFLGDQGFSKLRSSFIIVVGCGGVGSHAISTLVRSGVSKIRIIDFDQVTLSSLNRHSVATLSDVGTSKVYTIKKRLQKISPWTKFDCRNELFCIENASKQLEPWNDTSQSPDFVIDAIDNIDSKVDLLSYCHENNLKVMSSMGAGVKSDPSRIFIGDISTTTDDPLSKSTRVRLKQKGITSGIPVVFSTEKWVLGKAQLLPLDQAEFEKGKVEELGVLEKFRVRILPVLGTMPAIFGLSAANHVILEISGYPYEYLKGKDRNQMYAGILANLQGQEERIVRKSGQDCVGLKLPISVYDVEYLVEEVFHGKSVISSLSNRLILVRWKKPIEELIDYSTSKQKLSTLKMKDLVLMTKQEGERHEKLVLQGSSKVEDIYDANALSIVTKRLADEEEWETYR